MSKKKYHKARTEYEIHLFDEYGNKTGEIIRVHHVDPNNGLVETWAKQEGISYNNWKIIERLEI